jgi:two-component system chemotaxis sensor kinase CheA
LRIAAEKLDRLLNLIGEITILRGRLGSQLRNLGGRQAGEILETHEEMERLHADLHEQVMETRMVAVGTVFQPFTRVVRELSLTLGKQAELQIEGAEVALDNAVAERLREPLTHMIRNAIDHGVEPAQLRRERGKPACARLTLRALREDGGIVIQLADDGGGFQREKILARAGILGLVIEPEKLSEPDLYRLLLEPGFSTADAVTELSGRGMGMDIIRRSIEALHGTIALDSRPELGATITLRLPLTLTIINGFSVAASGEIFVIPTDAVIECVELPEEGRRGAADGGVFDWRGETLPYLRLSELFGMAGTAASRESVVVLRHAGGRTGFAVDALCGQSPVVIKPLGPLFDSIPGIAGSTITGDGRVALILDVPRLIHRAAKRHPGLLRDGPGPARIAASR